MARNLALSALVLLAGLMAHAADLRAAELLMFEDPACSWCRRWHREVGPSYPRSPEGLRAPLRRVHIRDQRKAGVSLAGPINVTPTFVLAHDGRELGRIIGYPSRDFFYPMVAELLDRLSGSAPHRVRPP
jgi:thioredoxin-related protein